MPDRATHDDGRDPAWELLERLIKQLQAEIGSVSEPKFADIMRALEMRLKYGDRGQAERTFWKLAAALRREIYGEHFNDKEDSVDDEKTTEASDLASHRTPGAAGCDGRSNHRCPQHSRGRRG